MENWNKPNSMDVFRNMFVDRPPVVNKYLQFLSIYDEHNVIVGATNMGDIYWTGTIYYYNDVTNLNKENAVLNKQIDNGVNGAVYLSQDKFVVVGDHGAVEIFQIVQIAVEQRTHDLQILNFACQHDDSILSVSLFSNKKNIVTSGMDYCIKVWDVEDLIATHSYSFAHSNIVTSTDVKPTCNFVFASTSLSGDALLWDIRQSKPAHCILDRNHCSLTAISWKTASDHILAIGEDYGGIALMDIRQTRKPISESISSDRGVHKLLFNPNPERLQAATLLKIYNVPLRFRKEQLACCFDNSYIKVLNSEEEMRPVIENCDHMDYVRGLAWHKNDLFSCAWDDTVMKHTVSSDNDDKCESIM